MSPLRRLPDPPNQAGAVFPECHDPEHNPPGHISLPPGRYEYTCPSCHRRIEFTVAGVYYGG